MINTILHLVPKLSFLQQFVTVTKQKHFQLICCQGMSRV